MTGNAAHFELPQEAFELVRSPYPGNRTVRSNQYEDWPPGFSLSEELVVAFHQPIQHRRSAAVGKKSRRCVRQLLSIRGRRKAQPCLTSNRYQGDFGRWRQ